MDSLKNVTLEGFYSILSVTFKDGETTQKLRIVSVERALTLELR